MPTCRDIYDGCCKACESTYTVWATQETCKYGCFMTYAECVTGEKILEIGEGVVDAAGNVVDWLQRHPEVVVGTVLTVAGVAACVYFGPGLLLWMVVAA